MSINYNQSTAPIKFLTVLVIIATVLIGCDKEGYKTYTETDDSGVVINGGDPTDWALDTEWEDGIDELIASGCTSEGLGETTSVTVNPAFPNPTSNVSNLIITTGDSTLLRIAIVDKTNTIYSNTCFKLKPGNNSIGFNLSSLTSNIVGRYRIYYDFLNESNTVFYKGHGDVVLE